MALAATATGDAVTFPQNNPITARPNVLRDQTMPNTLSGFSDPAAAIRRGGRTNPSLVRLGALVVVILGVLPAVFRLG